jgi:hypothetical protein
MSTEDIRVALLGAAYGAPVTRAWLEIAVMDSTLNAFAPTCTRQLPVLT